MQLFYHPEMGINSKEISFDREESKHISKVLRKKEGDILKVTNGKGVLFNMEIIQFQNHRLTGKILEYEVEKPKPYQLHLAVAPTKMNDRFEWFLEKATEIGVDEITPILCDHSERKNIKKDRFERVLQSAMKQSLHYTLPILNDLTPFSEFVKTAKNDQLFIAHCEEQQKFSLQTMVNPMKNSSILIGPEGDFSAQEIDLALQNGFSAVSLGNSRLRTETAAIVACHTVALINEIPLP
ncbi:MAG TPA: 16S rRNA (uracil(1498)-N(3))-methyltransferase [Flavobacteriaceae bacterium]|nr:16S rRNA (uracil(1498)-N(3))-methyltransferase [Flavobacteriaceae bacterium]